MAELYSDLPLNFTPNPNTGDVKPASGEKAVRLALLNLIRTPIGSRPYNPNFGSRVFEYLFKPADPLTEDNLTEDLAYAIRTWEPRVDLISIETNMEDYGIEIIIEYYAKGFSQPQQVSTVINKV